MNLEELLENSTPTQAETLLYMEAYRQIVDAIRTEIDKSGLKAEPVLVGSVAKGTNLKGSDLDIFIAFSKEYTEEQIEQNGIKIAKKVLPGGKARYAEHPYISGEYHGINTDIVPCYNISPGETKISSVDRTILHTRYVNENLKASAKKEVRKLKLFMKVSGIYGADVITSGFSGYVCELLIIIKKTFDSVIEMGATLRGNMNLSECVEPNAGAGSPVCIVDPTDSRRNAGAAVSLESLTKFKLACRLYKARGYEGLTESVSGAIEHKAERGTAYRLISIDRPDRTDDVLYPQALRLLRKLEEASIKEGYGIIGDTIFLNEKKVLILLEFDRSVVPEVVLHEGPPVDNGNVLDFLEKWKGDRVLRGPYVKGNRVYAEILREFTKIDDFLGNFLTGLGLGGSLEKMRNSLEIVNPSGKVEYNGLIDSYLSRGLFR